MPLKVMQIGGTYEGGGPGSTTQVVHTALLAEGIDSTVCQTLSKTDAKNVITVSKKGDLFIRKILRKLKLNLSQFELVRTARIIKAIKLQNPDIVNLRVIHHGLINYKKLLKYFIKQGKPIILTLHDMWYITGGCYHFIDADCDGYKSGCKNCPKKRNKLDCFPFETHKHWNAKKNLFKKAKNIEVVCVSEWSKSFLSESFLKNASCTVIPNAVDTSVFHPICVSVKNDKKIVLGVANFWSKEKGIFDFIELSKKLDSSYQIVIVGSIPSTILEEVKKTNIKLLGKIKDRKELAQIFSNCDVFVQLSYQETFGNVVLEAACCGKRTIGYNITAIPEVLKEVNGIIVSAGDVDSVCEAIKKVCKSNDVLSDQEISKIHNKFSKERLCDQHIKLYKEVSERINDKTFS